ncbi:MAG: ABC transporter ATP-binding protein [Treponema sp.]|jgi:iron complex transport system ATP-binding protein|nr:ABC transporter ATP-binding protein [Treponema sp.]
MNTKPILTVDHLDAGIGKKTILQNINLEIRPGELLAIVGPNGSGKTTLIKTIASFLPRISGNIFLHGKEISSLKKTEKAKQLAVIFQSQGLPWPFSVKDFILQGRFPHHGWFGVPQKSDERIAEKAIRDAGLESLQDRLVSELSGGEYQRVLIARALAQEAQLFLFDEPVSYLDVKYQLAVMDLIRHSVDGGIAAMISLHDVNIAALYADRIALIANGSIVALGTPQEVFTKELLAQTFDFSVPVGTHPLDASIPEIFYPLRKSSARFD